MGSGIDTGSLVRDMIIDNSDNLVAGGIFTSAGVSANNIAKWNGSAWSPFVTGTTGGTSYVDALAWNSTNNSFYVGGYFTSAGGVSAVNIAKFNGTTWSVLSSGMNGRVYDLKCDSSGNLYACGAFTNAGGVGANFIAKWDGATWSALGSGMNTTIWSIAIDGSNVYAGGEFNKAHRFNNFGNYSLS
ncbi:MAG: hypothetical protein HQM10_10895 [Candidatus Riflebacteria bacterium]|nr:hypothetical protein [Candidatus Riflebacteria bacterium]